jgi:hypothetical protein
MDVNQYREARDADFDEKGNRRGDPIPGEAHPPYIPDDDLFFSGAWLPTLFLCVATLAGVVLTYLICIYIIRVPLLGLLRVVFE